MRQVGDQEGRPVEHQRIVLQPHLDRAERRVHVNSSVRGQLVAGARVGDPGLAPLLFPLPGLGGATVVELLQLDAPIADRIAKVEVEDAEHEGVAQLCVVAVGEDHDAELVVGEQADDGHRAVDAAGVEGDERAAIVLEEPAEAVGGEAGPGELRGGVELIDRDHDLGPEELSERVFAHEPLIAPLASVQQEAEPAGHVHDVGVHGAGGSDGVDEPDTGPGDELQRVVDLVVDGGDVLAALQENALGDGLGHAEGLEDPLADQGVPRGIGGPTGDDARGGVGDVVIGEAGAEAGGRLDEAEPVDDLGKVDVDAIPQVPGIAEPDTMSQQVTDRQLVRRIRFRKQVARNVVGDPVVPLQLSLVHQHGDGHGGEGLGGGRVGEQCVDVHRIGPAQGPEAVTAGEDDRVVLDHGDGESGDLPVVDRLADVGIETGERVVRRGLRRDASGQDEQQEYEPNPTHLSSCVRELKMEN